MEIKQCRKCKEEKPLDQFSKDNSKKDKLQSMCKLCYINYTSDRKDIRKEYNQKNIERDKQYLLDNKVNINKRLNLYYKKRRENDVMFKLKHYFRSNIHQCLSKNNHYKNCKTEKILGCTFEEFKLYIESKFEPWMSWDNRGNPKDGILEYDKTWDIDHIIPLDSALTQEEIYKLNHYTNLRPLCSYFNRFIKKNKYE